MWSTPWRGECKEAAKGWSTSPHQLEGGGVGEEGTARGITLFSVFGALCSARALFVVRALRSRTPPVGGGGGVVGAVVTACDWRRPRRRAVSYVLAGRLCTEAHRAARTCEQKRSQERNGTTASTPKCSASMTIWGRGTGMVSEERGSTRRTRRPSRVGRAKRRALGDPGRPAPGRRATAPIAIRGPGGEQGCFTGAGSAQSFVRHRVRPSCRRLRCGLC